jgi:protoheme IX farnesyltransferase
VVVAHDLAPWLVLVHLGLAMLIVGFLIATAVMAMPPSRGVPSAAFRRLAAVATGATFVMLLTGSTVVASSADQACRSWPLCGNGFQLSFAGVDVWTMLHRGAVLLVGLLLLHVLSTAFRRWRKEPGMGAVAGATLVIFVLQVAVGAGAAITDAAFFNGLHVALATLVWSGVLATALLTLPRADAGPELSRLSVERSSA